MFCEQHDWPHATYPCSYCAEWRADFWRARQIKAEAQRDAALAALRTVGRWMDASERDLAARGDVSDGTMHLLLAAGDAVRAALAAAPEPINPAQTPEQAVESAMRIIRESGEDPDEVVRRASENLERWRAAPDVTDRLHSEKSPVGDTAPEPPAEGDDGITLLARAILASLPPLPPRDGTE